MIRRGVEGRTSNAFCGGLTGRRWAPADPIRRRSDRDRNDDMGRDGCPRALDLRGVAGRHDRRGGAPAVAGWVAMLAWTQADCTWGLASTLGASVPARSCNPAAAGPASGCRTGGSTEPRSLATSTLVNSVWTR